jgi:hypothetical protein
MRLLSFAMLAVLAGCGASMHERADKALKRGNFREAAELYDQLVAKHPEDPNVLARRTEARHGVLRQIFTANQAARRNNDRPLAIKHLTSLLAQRDDWAMAIEPRYTTALAAEVGMAGQDIAIDVDHATNTVGPLAGEHTLGGHADLLARADFGGRGASIYEKVRTVGRTWCGKLAGDATTPYWRWLMDRYCTHWGVANRVGTVELANLRSDLLVHGDVAGQSEAETVVLREAVRDAFRASVWYAPNAANPAFAKVGGKVAIAFSQRPTTLHTTWTEEVPYTDYETSQESYQEPYDDTESYSEQVPYTATETKSVPCGCTNSRGKDDCGPSNCTETETVTKYRTEWKTRTVTKYRTQWRTVTNEVTKYRTVTHPYSYSATELGGTYHSTLNLRVTAPESTDQPWREGASTSSEELLGVTAAVELADSATGIDHDVTFGPADVSPTRANLPSREYVLERETGRLQARVVAAFDERYAKLYCTAPRYDREAAAACAYLDLTRAPAAVRTVLRGTFGGDEAYLAPVLMRTPTANDRVAREHR